MDKRLEIYKLTKPLYELVSLNGAVSIKEMEFLFKSLSTNKPLIPAMFTGEFLQTFKK